MFEGCERLFRPGYLANLVQSWIPALDGVQAKLERGAQVADIGCGHGASTIILAKAYPNSCFYGFDGHLSRSSGRAHLAEEAGVADRVTFEVAKGTDYPGTGYDLGRLLRLPPRHGRPRQQYSPHARGAGAQRDSTAG